MTEFPRMINLASNVNNTTTPKANLLQVVIVRFASSEHRTADLQFGPCAHNN